VVAALLLSAFAGALNASGTLSIARRANWPGYGLGNVMGLDVTGSTVWLGVDCYSASIGSLVALDVSDPASTVVLSSIPTGVGYVWAFEGTFAYAAGSSSSAAYLEVYDLADPRQPVRLSRTSISSSGGMMAHQGFLWLCADAGVETFDVRNPSAPKPAGSLQWAESQRPSQMLHFGDFGVIMTTTITGTVQTQYFLRVLDLRNPTQPTETDSMTFSIGNVGGWPFLVLASVDDYLYYVTGTASGMNQGHLHAVRITSLGEIEPTAVDLPLTESYEYRLWSVGSYLYFYGTTFNPATYPPDTYWLRVVDATERLAPKTLATPVITIPSYPMDLVSCDGRAFLPTGGIGGPQALFALHVANPAQPVALGAVWRNWGYQRSLYGLAGGSEEPVWRVQDAGTSRIRLHGAARLLQGNGATDREVDLPFVPGSTGPEVLHVLLHSDHCYVLSGPFQSAARLDVFDLSGTGPPAHTGTQLVMVQSSSGGFMPDAIYHRVKIEGNALYLSYLPGALDIYALGTPASPEFASSASIGLPHTLEVHNGYAYLFTDASGTGSRRQLEVVDVRQPGNPSASTIFRQYSSTSSGPIAADGNLLYVVYLKWGSPNATVLEVFDLGNPLSPTLLSSTRVAEGEKGYVRDLAVLKPYALLVGDGMLVVDISDSSQPKPLGTYTPFPQIEDYSCWGVYQVRAWQNHVVIQNDPIGIEILDVLQVAVSLGRLSNVTYSPATGFSFIFRDATVGQPYRIQRSSSLAEGSWVDWMNFTYTEPNVFTDLGAVTATNRFYRAVSP